MEILNKTKRPLAIPLPGGKKLRLGPAKTGQITPKACEHPPVKKLIEEGQIEVVGGGRGNLAGGSEGKTGTHPGQGGSGGASGLRHTGDR